MIMSGNEAWNRTVSYLLQAVGRKFSHRPGNPATAGAGRWPSAGDTAGYRLGRPKLTPVSLISVEYVYTDDGGSVN